MFDLDTIIVMNERASQAKPEDNFSRDCSYSGDPKNGVVLHSARLRNTVFLYPRQAKNFIRRWFSVNSKEAQNHLVESYFAGGRI